MQLLTNILNEEEFRDELRDAVAFLAQRGVTDVGVAFGFAHASPELKDVGVRYPVPIADVDSFIAEREQTKGFRLGTCDCRIEPFDLDARFHFCNDRDVHFTSESAELLDSIRAHWRTKGFKIYPDDGGKV